MSIFEDDLAKQLRRNIERAAIHLQARTKEALNVTGNPYIAARGKSIWYKNENPSSPGEPPHKMLGDLQRSIAYEISTPDGQTAAVGTNLNYGFYLEIGSSKMAARPWLRATLDKEADNLTKIITAPAS